METNETKTEKDYLKRIDINTASIKTNLRFIVYTTIIGALVYVGFRVMFG